MARRGSGLAARLREALEREENAQTAEEKERLHRLEKARAARGVLFDELAAFGEELGFATIEREDEAVTIRRAERWLRFAVAGQGDEVSVDFTGRDEHASHRLYREEALDGRWVWVRNRRSREDRLALFDQGLEVLLVHALDLPSPGNPAAPTTTPERRATGPASDPDGGTDDTPTPPVEVKRTL